MSFFIFLLLFFQVASSRQPLCHDNERSALLQFKESLSIDKSASSDPSAYSKTALWNLGEDSDCCLWDGVKCNEDTGYVTKLNLTSSGLYGYINSTSTLFNLVHLQWLSLADNHFRGSKIPSGIKNLSKLLQLSLSDSVFSGHIPSEIFELSKLESLVLKGNELLQLQQPGTISSSIGNLSNLAHLDLSYNNLQGTISSSIGNLSNLTHLDLCYNNLQGTIPSEMMELSRLKYLDLGRNFLSGTIPSSIGNLSKLVHLDIKYNNFFGELPISIGNLHSLVILYMENCQFSGQVPLSLSNLTQLGYLDISYNNFSIGNSSSLSWITPLTKLNTLALKGLNIAGEIPSSLMNLTQLTYFYMYENQLTGPIPYWLMNLNKLSVLYLMSNKLSGPIPTQISNLTSLFSLDLSSNQLQGLITSSISKLKSLFSLDLHSNQLNGTVDLDMFLCELKSLRVLSLSSNNLSVLTKTTCSLQEFEVIRLGSCNLAEFPQFLQNQDQLQKLDLSSNNKPGQIPGWFLNISRNGLTYLNLSHNLLTGLDLDPVGLPWTNLGMLDLRSNRFQGTLPLPTLSISHYLVSNNKLTGEILPWICYLNQLQTLDVSYNNLGGVLPRCLGTFSYGLSILGLQGNKFYGSIPETFMNGSSLSMVDLSHNKLQGKIPRSLANCTSLEYLNLGYNQITDSFPFWLGILPQLKVLILKSNRLHGFITEPKTDFDFSNLHIIDLSYNMLTGELPSKYFRCLNAMKVINESKLTYMQESLQTSEVSGHFYFGSVYTYFDFPSYAYSFMMSNKGIELKYGKISNHLRSISLSGNRFGGKIPASISNLRALNNLDLSNNNLVGLIPSSLGNLAVLESLDLSNNKLLGEIPLQLAELTSLEFINVSYNHLKGRIPQGKQFNTFENSSFEGNHGLCGTPLSKKCENHEASQSEDQGSSKSTFALDWKLVSIGFASGLIVGVVLGNEFCAKIIEWFVTNFGWQLKRMKRRRGRRN